MKQAEEESLISGAGNGLRCGGVLPGLLLIAVACAAAGCGRGRASDPAPLTPRAQEIAARSESRRADARALLDWSRAETPVFSVTVPVDAFPNGLSMAMTPLLVDWGRSRLRGEPDDYYIIHNVAIGGNQARGQLLLGTVRAPARGVSSVEWNMVISRFKGRNTPGGHGQIRFLFRRDALPVVVARDGTPLHGDAEIDDLIISWEAWRPPGVRWSMKEGLDPERYALTVRCYDGAKRFVNDALLGNAWACYPLRLPDVPDALHDQLRTCLILGDAVARRTAQEILADSPYALGAAEEEIEEEVARLRARLSMDEMPDHPLVYVAGNKDLSYHLLLRSCITQALAAIDLGVQETYRRHGLGDRPRLQYAPETLPDWIYELAAGGGELDLTLARIGPTVTWLIRNTQVLPANAYRILDDGGLLQREDGRLVRFFYRADRMTPYGALGTNIAY